MNNKKGLGMHAKRTIGDIIIYIILTVMSIIWLTPFVCIVLQSFRTESTWQVGYVMPKVWGLDNYKAIFASDFVRWYINTLIIATVVAIVNTIFVLCMSYTLSRFRFKMREALMKFMLILGLFPVCFQSLFFTDY